MKALHALLCAVVLGCAAVSVTAAPTGTFDITPKSGVAPYVAKATWSVTGAASCAASGAWTGAKAVSGSQDVTITAASAFTLTCGTGAGNVTVRWVPPTTNTDGSLLNDLSGFNVYAGASGTQTFKKVGSVGKGIISFVDDTVTAGKWDYVVTAVNAQSVESARSMSSTITVQGESWQKSVSAAVVPGVPSPPTSVTTTETVAYEYRPSTNTLARIGIVSSGIPCGPETKVVGGVKYCRLDRTKADLVNWPNSPTLADVWVKST
jgi:hypothetical protein